MLNKIYILILALFSVNLLAFEWKDRIKFNETYNTFPETYISRITSVEAQNRGYATLFIGQLPAGEGWTAQRLVRVLQRLTGRRVLNVDYHTRRHGSSAHILVLAEDVYTFLGFNGLIQAYQDGFLLNGQPHPTEDHGPRNRIVIERAHRNETVNLHEPGGSPEHASFRVTAGGEGEGRVLLNEQVNTFQGTWRETLPRGIYLPWYPIGQVGENWYQWQLFRDEMTQQFLWIRVRLIEVPAVLYPVRNRMPIVVASTR